jgi:hypothetical protein
MIYFPEFSWGKFCAGIDLTFKIRHPETEYERILKAKNL